MVKRLIIAATLIAGVGACSFLMRSQPVIFSYAEVGSMTKEPVFSIFNPLRDREPERSAEQFLQRLQSGRCEAAISKVDGSFEYKQVTCDRERVYRLKSWQLKNRTDESQSVRLYYEVMRQTYHGLTGQVWITVEKKPDAWHVTRYDRAY